MTANILDGKSLAQKIRQQLKEIAENMYQNDLAMQEMYHTIYKLN